MVIDSIYEENTEGIAEVGCFIPLLIAVRSSREGAMPSFINSSITDLMEGAAFFKFVEEETEIEIYLYIYIYNFSNDTIFFPFFKIVCPAFLS